MDRAGPRPRPARPAEAGVALMIVLVVLFIVAVLMADVALTAATARRSAHNASTEFLMNAAVDRKFQVALAQIRYEPRAKEADHAFTTLDDRWALDDFTNDEKEEGETGGTTTATAASSAGAEEESEGVTVFGEGGKGEVKATLGRLWNPEPDPDLPEMSDPATPVEDEERKFNLYLLLHPDDAVRKVAEEKLDVLVDRYREDTPLDFSAAVAQQFREEVVKYLRREPAAEGQTGIPVPGGKSGWRILTPDEIANAPGLEAVARKVNPRLIVRDVLHDAQDPSAYDEYLADPEGREEPPAYPGLLRYVTIWSGDAFKGELRKDSKFPVNINTASRPVLMAVFSGDAPNFAFVQKVLEFRRKTKEGSPEPAGSSSGEDAPLVEHERFEKLEDLANASKVEGYSESLVIPGDVPNRPALIPFFLGVKSSTFSIFVKAEREAPPADEDEGEEEAKRRQAEAVRLFRFVVRRADRQEAKDADDVKKGIYRYRTILREERTDRWFAPKETGDVRK